MRDISLTCLFLGAKIYIAIFWFFIVNKLESLDD